MTSMCLHVVFFNHSTSTLEHTLIFLKCMVNKHVFMNFVSLNKKLALASFETWQNSVFFQELVPHTLIGIMSVVR